MGFHWKFPILVLIEISMRGSVKIPSGLTGLLLKSSIFSTEAVDFSLKSR